MSIINSQTPQQAAAIAKGLIIQKMNFALRQLNQTWVDCFNLVWSNSTAAPQDVLDAFGSDAAELFLRSSQTQSFVNQQSSGLNVLTPPFQFVINKDGTVTVGAAVNPSPGNNV